MLNEEFDRSLVALIKTGMMVYDARNQRVGVVDYVQFGNENDASSSIDTPVTVVDENLGDEHESLLEWATRGMGGEDTLPTEVRSRLMRYGFVRVDAGLLKAERYVEPSQIMSVFDDEIHLNVDDDELLAQNWSE